MDLLHKAFSDRAYLLDLEASTIDAIVDRAIDLVVSRGVLAPDRRDEVRDSLIDREQLGSTAIGHAVAVPHVYLDCIAEQIIVFLRLAHPIDLGAPDGVPTRFVFVLLGPKEAISAHIDALMEIARHMADDAFRYDMGEASNSDDLLTSYNAFEKRNRPPEEKIAREADDGLTRTGQLFGGMLADFRRRLPHYASDFRDGLHLKTVSSALFLFFACLAPAITFGGIMAQLTNNSIGPIEMIVGTAVCGVVYALFSGQPLIILGGTGPLLIFTVILFNLCEWLEIPFLETRACIGIWTGLILLVLAATDASCLMRFFTRFTDEIFSALISIIFLVKAVEAMVDVFTHDEATHAKSFLSFLLALGTFYLAMSLSRFRRSRYLLPRMREFLADFGPAIALAAMTLVALWFHGQIDLDQLDVPDTFRPTADRAWLLNPLAVPSWVPLAAILPAVLVAALVYIDQNITARLVNSRDHKLQKGPAYHHDLAVMGVLVAVCSVLGWPWLVAATVRSLNHVRSLATVEEVVTPRGDTHERIIHVRENRLSGLAIHVLVGLSLLLLTWLRFVPMAVLYGLFFFMGVVSMAGNQLFERLNLWFMDTSLYPSAHYIRRVPHGVIHRFTLIQFACLIVLGIVLWLGEKPEYSLLSISFPLFLVLLVPLRHRLNRYFKQEHLSALDAEEDPEEEAESFV